MPIVAVGGLSSGVGKTQLIEKMLDVFRGSSVLKVSLREHYTQPRILTSAEDLLVPGKDTWRYALAGAGKIVWLSCRRENLGEMLPRALKLFDPGLLLTESNSVIAEIDPDVVVFVERDEFPSGSGRGSPKESAERARSLSDFNTREPYDNFDMIVERIQEVIQMSEEKAKELITQSAKDNKLPCAQAFRIAEETGVPKKRIGEILNEMDVKLMSCQLGCF